MRISMLDMGERRYGDCTLCDVDGTLILVDGGHRGDELGGAGAEPIPCQLRELVGGGKPVQIDLLVVTHCHSDHIGCLPELVGSGEITVKWALMADPRLGFGVPLGQPFPVIAKGREERVAAALREEPLSPAASDGEIRELIDAAATLQERYQGMIDGLEAAGGRVVRYGRDLHQELERHFAGIGLRILGPTVDQLLICAHRIERDRLQRVARAGDAVADGEDEVSLYRRLRCDDWADGAELDDGGAGAALNDQSIVLRIGVAPDVALLTGDMQFASPGVGGLRPRVDALRTAVGNAGPYAFVRLPHHGAANGTDEVLLDLLPGTQAFGISTGSGDGTHPAPSVLRLLEARSPPVTWARTDRNGLVSAEIVAGEVGWKHGRGALRDGAAEAGGQGRVRTLRSASKRRRAQQRGAATEGRLAVAPRLTFVTSTRRLEARVGPACGSALERVRQAGHVVLDLLDDAMTARDVAQAARGSAGIVILGGHSVVPSILVDCLSPSLRRGMRGGSRDPDDFVVWSDDPYGDADGLGLPQVPVSRIPDAGSAEFLLGALDPPVRAVSGRFGIRNDLRPFAERVFEQIGGAAAMLVSQPTGALDFRPEALDVENAYVMLHGYPDDGTRFSGEGGAGCDAAGHLSAMTIASIPPVCGATIFAGACYGATHMRDPTVDDSGERHVAESLALALLGAGARAFVGCVGTHWSPPTEPYGTAAHPMHEGFWRAMARGVAPSRALLEAKVEYVLGMPYGGDVLIEYKSWRQFTCLGLGW